MPMSQALNLNFRIIFEEFRGGWSFLVVSSYHLTKGQLFD
jgi:hypothetical protein